MENTKRIVKQNERFPTYEFTLAKKKNSVDFAKSGNKVDPFEFYDKFDKYENPSYNPVPIKKRNLPNYSSNNKFHPNSSIYLPNLKSRKKSVTNFPNESLINRSNDFVNIIRLSLFELSKIFKRSISSNTK